MTYTWAYRAGGGGGGEQSQSGNIRVTVGQYWLIIKINATNSVNFVGNSVNFVGNMLYLIRIFRNYSSPPLPTTILESFFGNFFLTTRAQSEKNRANFFPPP